MALIKEFDINPHTKIYFWHVVEKMQELEKGLELSETCHARLNEMKVDQMKCNFLAVRQLLNSVGYSPKDLYYNEHGKPFLKGDKKISISHSNDCVVVIISDGTVGVDIERKGEKVLNVAHKYTNWELNHSSLSNANTILKLLKVWAAKESLYKAHNKPGLSLKDEVNIKNFFPTDKKTSGRIVEEEKISYYDINFIEFEDEFEDYLISYCFLR